MKRILFFLVPALCIVCTCVGQSNQKTTNKQNSAGMANANNSSSRQQQFVEGKDYTTFQRVRLMDKVGFTEPQEAYSILIPKGWNSNGDILWNQPGTACAGTMRKMWARSADGNYVFEMLPDVLYSWNQDPQINAFNQQYNTETCRTGQPMNADTYLRQVFVRELGNAQVVSVEPNQAVINMMREWNTRAMNELQQYGAGQMQFEQSALNAVIKWNNGKSAMVTLGITTIATQVPNQYTGSYSMIYTSQVTKRTVFVYPSNETEKAKELFTMIMSSFRTNPVWNDAVNTFWKQARQRSNTVHIGRIKVMDEQTKRMGEQAVRNGQQRLNSMDAQQSSRTWEQSQNSQDRMHTDFIKTIREVENFRDETGKYEMTAGYDHAWSRGDGTSFILSNNPNFNAASVFQDQNWKPMQKVR